MPFYNVVLHAPCNGPIGSPPRGFYVPCFVRARDQAAAATKAKEIVRTSSKFSRIAARFGPELPVLGVDSIAPIPWYRFIRGQPGWVLYDESQPGPQDTRVV
jgi:hypothetical protein